MGAWLARRLAASIAIVFAVVSLTFALLQLAPGMLVVPGSDRPMDPEVRRALEERFGLDQPIHVRYLKYLANVGRGDLGESWLQRRPVARALADAIPNTLLLAGAALAIDFLLGVALGVFQARRRGQWGDVGVSQATLFLYSVPTFWLGLGVLLVFSEWLGWFPGGGMISPELGPSTPWLARAADVAWHLVLPGLTLGLVGAAGTARYQRAALLEALSQDFVRTARAKGASERRVVLRHALRNALLPTITLFGMALPFLLTGAVLTETVFSWPGMGRLAADAIFQRDYPLVTASVLASAVLVVLGSLLADVLYAAADPRIRVRTS
ncbi:MAG: ABC transporter permease [Gemmatimonadales bacterium]